jgi:hypothetical protein
MAFTNMKLTTFGSNIEAKCHQGKGLHFTRIAVGDGLLGNGSMINRTALVSERHSMQIDGIIATENTTQSAVIATLDNSVFTEGFYYREIALFAKDPDTNQEGAYLYDNAGQECEFLGLREDGVVIYERIKMLIRVEQTSQISFDGSGNPLYMSPEDVRGMIEQHNVSEDAHKTKADLGNDGLLKDSQRPKADGLYMPDGKTKISDKIVNIESAMLLALAAASPYSAAAAYAQGAYCTKDGKLYRCTVAIPQAEAWNAAHWTATTMGAELVAIYTTLANKAPGGFGLGAIWNQAPENDANQIPGTGWFVAHQNTPTGGWWIIQDIFDGSVHYQFAFAKRSNSGVLGGTIVQRNKQEQNDWSPWEWVNPPMGLNTEYRTTERYLSKPVYVKVVDCGNCPESGHKDIRFDTSGVALPIRCYGNWTYDGRSTIPFETTGSDRMVVGIIGSFIRITTGGRNFSEHTCTVTVYYTKTTD